jgi:hypothetical protein
MGRLGAGERRRLADLLDARAALFWAWRRPIACSRDLERLARLDPARGTTLTLRRAAAAAAAGDAWKAIGARDDARAAYGLATVLGGVAPGFGLPPAPPPITVPHPMQVDIDTWLVSGPALSVRLPALVAAHPWVLDDAPRALRWADLALDEDATSPDVLETAALSFGRARRFGGTERMLMEMTYYSPDRAAALARGAVVWERLRRPREACAHWIRAARWRDDPEDATWRKAIDCTRADPGAGDWREIRGYVLLRARPDRREALAAILDTPSAANAPTSSPTVPPAAPAAPAATAAPGATPAPDAGADGR